MDSLPVELLDNIVQFCDHASKKSLRQTTKTFENLATPSVFEHHYTAMFDDSLIKFESIANSRLAKHVNRLTYLNDTLPAFRKAQYLSSIDNRPDFFTFREQRKDDFPDEVRDWSINRTGRTDVFSRAWDAWEALERHNFTTKQLNQGWKEFSRLSKEQKQWGKIAQSSRIQAAFKKLPNLVEVDVVRASSENKAASQWPVWRRIRRDMLIGPDDWKEHVSASEEMIDFGKILETATLCLLEAIAQRNREKSGKPITAIRLQNDLSFPFSFVSNWTNSLYGTANDTRQWSSQLIGPLPLADAFLHITTFTVRFEDHADETLFSTLAAVWAQLHHFLSKASNLQRLTLLLEGDDNMPPFDEGLEDWDGEDPGINIFDSKTALWPQIQHLSLSINCSSTKLLGLLKIHADTLRSLEIRSSVFDDVPTLLEQIPQAVALEHVYLKNLWHCGPPDLPHENGNDACMLSHGIDNQQPYEIAMKKYLLGEAGGMPDILQDDLGHIGSNARKNPPDTVFGPHRNQEHKRALLEF